MDGSNRMKLKWKEIGGAVTPGGDTAFMCPVCFHGEHIYGIEHPEPIHECPVCGAELIYPWEEQNENSRRVK